MLKPALNLFLTACLPSWSGWNNILRASWCNHMCNAIQCAIHAHSVSFLFCIVNRAKTYSQQPYIVFVFKILKRNVKLGSIPEGYFPMFIVREFLSIRFLTREGNSKRQYSEISSDAENFKNIPSKAYECTKNPRAQTQNLYKAHPRS